LYLLTNNILGYPDFLGGEGFGLLLPLFSVFGTRDLPKMIEAWALGYRLKKRPTRKTITTQIVEYR
jgi:hypothetical protein